MNLTDTTTTNTKVNIDLDKLNLITKYKEIRDPPKKQLVLNKINPELQLENILKMRIQSIKENKEETIITTKNNTVFKNKSKLEALKDIATVNGYRF